jgi:hypothetical protein
MCRSTNRQVDPEVLFRIVELLHNAIEWRRQLDTGEVRNQDDIARREVVTRARVTQVPGLLRLAPEIQNQLVP